MAEVFAGGGVDDVDVEVVGAAALALRQQRHRRLLANGHCAPLLELDCRFQTVREGCGFYQTGPEFITILPRQRATPPPPAPSSTTNS